MKQINFWLVTLLLLILSTWVITLNAQSYGNNKFLSQRKLYNDLELAYGDVDNDQDLDVIYADGNDIFLAIRTGPETFAEPIDVFLGSPHVFKIFLADFNGNGLADILFSREEEIFWSENLGDLSFADPIELYDLKADGFISADVEEIDKIVHDIVVDDIDNDGDLDIAYASLVNIIEEVTNPGYYGYYTSYNNGIIIHSLVNDGSGNFTYKFIRERFFEVNDAEMNAEFCALQIKDLDGNGLKDFVGLYDSEDKRHMFGALDQGIPVFDHFYATFPEEIEIGSFQLDDFNQDGVVEVVLNNTGTWYLTNAIFQVFAEGQLLNDSFDFLRLFDWNKDGLSDAITVGESGIHFYENLGSGIFDAPTLLDDRRPNQIQFIESGSNTKILMHGSEPGVLLIEPDNPASPSIPIDDRGVYQLTSIALVDLENDELMDVVCAKNEAQGLSYFENLGGLTFSEEIEITNAPSHLNKVVSTDIDADGLLDVFHFGQSEIGYMINNGDKTFTDPVQTSIDAYTTFDIGYLNGNESLDLVVAHADFLSVYMDFATGSGFETDQTLDLSFYPNTEWLKIADLDSDGLNDLVLDNGGLAYFNNLDASFEFSSPEFPLESMDYRLLDDFNEDGALDVVALKDGTYYLIANEGAGSNFIIERFFDANPLPSLVPETFQYVDIQGDGRKDLVRLSEKTFPRFFQIPVNPNFPTPLSVTLFGPSGTSAGLRQAELIFQDLDGDGDPDVVSADQNREYVRVDEYLNNDPNPLFETYFTHTSNCSADSILFINKTNTYFPNTTFTWDFGNGTTSDEAFPLNGFNAPANLSVTLTACNDSGCESYNENVAVTDQELDLTPSYNIPSEGFAGQSIQFSDNTATMDNWTWIMGDGTIYSEQSPTHVYSEAGTYNIELIITNSQIMECTFSINQTIIISESTGLNDLAGANIEVYPIPIENYVLIKGLSSSSFHYRLTDAIGRLIQKGKIDGDKIQFKESLQSGIYFLEIVDEQGKRFRVQVLK